MLFLNDASLAVLSASWCWPLFLSLISIDSTLFVCSLHNVRYPSLIIFNICVDYIVYLSFVWGLKLCVGLSLLYYGQSHPPIFGSLPSSYKFSLFLTPTNIFTIYFLGLHLILAWEKWVKESKEGICDPWSSCKKTIYMFKVVNTIFSLSQLSNPQLNLLFTTF